MLGYNLSKCANGLELTVAHGGWRSEAHDRYERFQHSSILSIPARMLGGTSVFEDSTVRDISRERRPRGSAGVPLWHRQPGVRTLCREGTDVCVLDRRDRSQARCSPSVCHRRRRRAPSVGCAPCATALARPLLFTGFACHVRVLDIVVRIMPYRRMLIRLSYTYLFREFVLGYASIFGWNASKFV